MFNHEEQHQALVRHFEEFIGNRLFILIPQFPFMFIGTLLAVRNDQLIIDVERTHIEQLENRIWEIHIDTIHTFFIERDEGPTIPTL